MVYPPRRFQGPFGIAHEAPGRCLVDGGNSSGGSGSAALCLLDHLYPEELPSDGIVTAARGTADLTLAKPRPCVRQVRAFNQASLWNTRSSSPSIGRGNENGEATSAAEAAASAGSESEAVKHEGETAAATAAASRSTSSKKNAARLTGRGGQPLRRGGVHCWTESMEADFFLQSFSPADVQGPQALPPGRPPEAIQWQRIICI